jgi:hypothetical protein
MTAAAGFLDNFFKCHRLELGAFLQLVQVHHICIVVLALVALKGFLDMLGSSASIA